MLSFFWLLLSFLMISPKHKGIWILPYIKAFTSKWKQSGFAEFQCMSICTRFVNMRSCLSRGLSSQSIIQTFKIQNNFASIPEKLWHILKMDETKMRVFSSTTSLGGKSSSGGFLTPWPMTPAWKTVDAPKGCVGMAPNLRFSLNKLTVLAPDWDTGWGLGGDNDRLTQSTVSPLA